MRKQLFFPSVEGEARILLLIDGFTTNKRGLDGRTKLAKLDFFLRYPAYLQRALKIRASIEGANINLADFERDSIEDRMIRYRYGPWDPAYFAILGRLIGKELVEPVNAKQGIGYRSTNTGRELSAQLGREEAWIDTSNRVKLLRIHFDLSGTTLKKFVYEHFPEVTRANWGQPL